MVMDLADIEIIMTTSTRYTQTDPDIRRCSLCKEHKKMSEFHLRVPKRGWYHSQCKECQKKDRKVKRKTPERQATEREWYLKTNYGICVQEYEDLLEIQKNVCAICKHPEHRTDNYGGVRRLAVDHCHDTGKVRGLLCGDCNTAIGLLGDNVDTLKRAIIYLDGDTDG